MGWFSRRFDRKVEKGVAQLRAEAQAAAAAGSAPTAEEVGQALADVPPCVRRYLEQAATSAPAYSVVVAKHRCQILLTPKGPWRALKATQHASISEPSLLWQVRSNIGPLLRVKGVDGLVGGQGRVDWRLWGWLPLQKVAGGEDLNKTMLVRWLSEAIASPHALMPSTWLKWEAVPGAENEACAVVVHPGSGTTASAVFTFDDAGMVSSFRTHDYVRPGQPKRLWMSRYRNYKLVPAPTINQGSGQSASQRKSKAREGRRKKDKGRAASSKAASGESPPTVAVDATAGAAAVASLHLCVPEEGEALFVEEDGTEFVYIKLRLDCLGVE